LELYHFDFLSTPAVPIRQAWLPFFGDLNNYLKTETLPINWKQTEVDTF